MKLLVYIGLILSLYSCIHINKNKWEALEDKSQVNIQFGEILSNDSLDNWANQYLYNVDSIYRVDSSIIFEARYKSPAFYVYDSTGNSLMEKICNANMKFFIDDFKSWQYKPSDLYEQAIFNFIDSKLKTRTPTVVFCFKINELEIARIINNFIPQCDSLNINYMVINSDNPNIEGYKNIYMDKWNQYIEYNRP